MKRGILNNIGQGTQRLFSGKTTKGQTSLIMILVLAMAFIFYAISLNWSRMAALKTTTWMTATNAASQTASMFASYGERVMWEGLLLRFGDDVKYSGKGTLKYEESTWLVLKIITIVIVVVILCLLQQYWAAAIVGAMMVAALVVDYAVVRPMLFNMWNKLQQNMQVVDQFRETGVGAGIQGLATDSVSIADRFDANGNGAWGFNAKAAEDFVSRFSLYYTERLKLIKPPDGAAYEGFRQALKNLVNNPYNDGTTAEPSGLGFNPLCTGSNRNAPQCDPMCTGRFNRPSTSNSVYRGGNNNSNALKQYVPNQCMRACVGPTCPPIGNAPFYLLYDNSLEMAAGVNPFIPDPENPANPVNSFRFRLGHDDEVGKDNGPLSTPAQPEYDPKKATGIVFPMLVLLDTLEQDKALSSLQGLSPAVAQAGIKTNIDPVVSKNDVYNFKAPINSCAQKLSTKTGFNWKRGADRYCAGPLSAPAYKKELAALQKSNAPQMWKLLTTRHWPYYQCQYMYNAEGTPITCSEGDATSGKNGWISPQDDVDSFVYEISDFIKINAYIQGLSKENLISSLDTWYPKIAEYIAPQCSIAACTEYTTECKSKCSAGDTSCENRCSLCKGVDYENPTSDLDQFAKSIASYTLNADGTRNYTYAYNMRTCNPLQHGAMIRWIYVLKNWYTILYNPSGTTNKGWLTETFPGNSQTDLCRGSLPDIITCLEEKKIYVDELNKCKQDFPVPTTTAGVTTYPKMKEACTKVIYKAQQEPEEFFTILSGVPVAPADPTIVYPTATVTKEVYEAIQVWLNDNTILKNAVAARYEHISKLKDYAYGTADLFAEGGVNFLNFLSPSGPASALMAARSSRALHLKRLPGFVIYGWKDNSVRVLDKTKKIGSWHLARMEVVQPDILPMIDTWQDIDIGWGGLDVVSHYDYIYGYGNIYTRATVWNESTAGGLANFANKTPIWRFRYNNPNPPKYNPLAPTADDKKMAQEIEGEALANPQDAIAEYCTGVDRTGQVKSGLPVFGKGIGLSEDTQIALQQDFSNINPRGYPMNPPLRAVSDEAKAYREAFMLNLDPRMKVPTDSPYQGGCSEQSCKTNNWSCCNSSNHGYWGNHWVTYCQSANKAACAQNAKNKEIRAMIKDTAKCFYAVNALLNQGIKSMGGAEFWVPPKSAANKNEYHEQINFLSAQKVKDDKKFDETNTLLDTDLYK